MKEALNDEFLVNAMQEELVQFEKNGLQELVPRPSSTNIIGTKCIYKNKYDDSGVFFKKITTIEDHEDSSY